MATEPNKRIVWHRPVEKPAQRGEWGLVKNEDPSQGAFIIEQLTELVEEAMLLEFECIAERDSVLGDIETGYQRVRLQDESMHCEMFEHTGELALNGVNTFRRPAAVTPNAL